MCANYLKCDSKTFRNAKVNREFWIKLHWSNYHKCSRTYRNNFSSIINFYLSFFFIYNMKNIFRFLDIVFFVEIDFQKMMIEVNVVNSWSKNFVIIFLFMFLIKKTLISEIKSFNFVSNFCWFLKILLTFIRMKIFIEINRRYDIVIVTLFVCN